MWLLDVNLPNGLIRLLQSYGIHCDTTARRGWRDLTNGALAEAASVKAFGSSSPGIASSERLPVACWRHYRNWQSWS
jgi:hypothetical protein